jgi:hypothetical protein
MSSRPEPARPPLQRAHDGVSPLRQRRGRRPAASSSSEALQSDAARSWVVPSPL